MNIVKHIINWAVWGLLALYMSVIIALRIPAVQQFTGQKTAQLLSQKLGTQVEIGRVDFGFLNRIIIDNVVIKDQQQKNLLQANRIAARIDLLPLGEGRISVSTAQILGAQLSLYRQHAEAKANYQFLIDSLASKDTTQQVPLNLQVNSFIMRHSSLKYDQLDAQQTSGRLNPAHLHLTDISAHILLKTLTDDSLNVNIKRLAFNEQSGMAVKRLALQLTANKQRARLTDLALDLPQSQLRADSVLASYQFNEQGFIPNSASFKGGINNTYITPSDLKVIAPLLKDFEHRIYLTATFSGNASRIELPKLNIHSTDNDIAVVANGWVGNWDTHPVWHAQAKRLVLTDHFLDVVSRQMKDVPAMVARLGFLQLEGQCDGLPNGDVNAQGNVTTSLGQMVVNGRFNTVTRQLTGTISTEGFNLNRLLDDERFDDIAANLEVEGTLPRQGKPDLGAKGQVSRFRFDEFLFSLIDVDGHYCDGTVDSHIRVDGHHRDTPFGASIDAGVSATSINDAQGTVLVSDLSIGDYRLKQLCLKSGYDQGTHFLTLDSDFADAELTGRFDWDTLAQSLVNFVGSKLPTLPGLPPVRPQTANDFTLTLQMQSADWLQSVFGVPLTLNAPVSLQASVNDYLRNIDLRGDMPDFTYDGATYQTGHVFITSPNDTMRCEASLTKRTDDGGFFDIGLQAHAHDNQLSTSLRWNNNARKPLSGIINAVTQLHRNLSGEAEAQVSILPSLAQVGPSTWQIAPADIVYTPSRLSVKQFNISHNDQYISVNGIASKHAADSLVVDLSKVEVEYILNLVNFHAVDFGGEATGRAFVSSAFATPQAHGRLRVDHFTFEHGRMGTLTANVDWNQQESQIDIDAVANDGPEATTYINGYVSPSKNFIDLAIVPRGTYIDFVQSFTSSFLKDVTGHADGALRLAGPLDAINLTGQIVADGQATVTALNTTYRLKRDTVVFRHNEIELDRAPVYDKYDNKAYLSGALHHKDLTNLTFDLSVEADNLLAYDFKDFGEDTFYGTVFAAGTVYNVSNPDAISNQEFITWRTKADVSQAQAAQSEEKTSPTDIYLNFLINATPDAAMRLLMDAKTGDYIVLRGDGSLRATYHNNGTFQLFGTYTVSRGTYDITIQNIIKKNFTFQEGGTIVFGGDPYDAALNLQAVYTVNGVSLSDLQLGNSFSSNTIRVNCLMNIAGQPKAPQVTFDLDMPTVNADEKQMVRSLLASGQEMNQQVLYLLGIGRFYNQQPNNASEQQDQTALAMQSFLSGTLSTQINTVLNSVIKNNDWNFGANISTGTEGWNNAEYEGIINGRMLNNRLLINGQFGYRDNATRATPSFIGDFDIRYLLYPNGNLALKVYNQTNDRYFTRSSLNTQGIGLIMKKDFNGLPDLFGRKKKSFTTTNTPTK